MLVEIIKYKNVMDSIQSEMDNSPYKKEYIVKQIKMNTATFYRKLKYKTFTADELLAIAKVLQPNEYLEYVLDRAEQDIKHGRLSSSEDVMKRLRNKIG